MFTWMWQYKRPILLMLLGAYLLSLGTHQLVYDGTPTFVFLQKEKDERQQLLTIYFPPMQVDGFEHSKPLQSVWLEYGDVLVVNYDPEYTDSDVIAETTHREVKRLGHEELMLDGISVGGRLLTDFINYDREQGNQLTVRGAVVGDPPMTGANILGSNKSWGWGVSFLFPDFAFNRALGWLVGAAHNPPSLEEIEPGVNVASIKKHWQISARWPLSGVASQARSVFWRQVIPAGTYEGIELIVIRSASDHVVSRSADAEWLAAFNAPANHVLLVTSPYGYVFHASVREFPTAWQEAQTKAYQQLLS